MMLASACGGGSAPTGNDNTPGPPSALAAIAGEGQTTGELQSVPTPPAVKVTDAQGRAVPNVSVQFTVVSGNGTVSGATQSTRSDGVAAVGSWTLGAPGDHELRATVGSSSQLAVTFHATATARAVASVQVSASAQTVLVDGTVQVLATPRDDAGGPLSTRPVTWTSGDLTRATVSAAGVVTALLPGPVSITGTIEGKSGAVIVTVTAPTLTPDPNGLTGHFMTYLNHGQGPPAGFGYGVSYYSAVFALNANASAGTQLGWGSWMMPDNRGFAFPLCPPGTVARDNWPERGPSYQDVYQNIEGGVGKWISTAFPTARPKFRVNATPDCYNTQVASTGWDFGLGLLPANKLGLAQLSNRLLLPPDGLAFGPGAETDLFGHGWIALPLIPAMQSHLDIATGDQSLTLFARAANFRGPVAFYTPETWSAVNALDPTRDGVGHGHDARHAFLSQLALEIGTTPAFIAQAPGGGRYARVPRLTFPVDGTGRALLLQDARFYSKNAIWHAVGEWITNGTVATGFNEAGVHAPVIDQAPGWSHMGVRLKGTEITWDGSFRAGAVTTSGGGGGMGMRWMGALEPGVLPEYYIETGTGWAPVSPDGVPRRTWLADQAFPPHQGWTPPAVNQSAGSPWHGSGWAAGPFTSVLGDGSSVTYVWYRFVDQPAISRLGLTVEVRQRLQAFVESLHQQSGLAGISFAAPTSGTLATLDAGQLVAPPAGLEKGYVPIVIQQR